MPWPSTQAHLSAGRPSPECPHLGRCPHGLVHADTSATRILSPTTKTPVVLLPHPPGPLLWGQDTPLRAVFIMKLRWVTSQLGAGPSLPQKDPSPGPPSSWPQAPSHAAGTFSGRSSSCPVPASVSAPSSCHSGHFDLNVAVENALQKPQRLHLLASSSYSVVEKLRANMVAGLSGQWTVRGFCAG